MRCRALVLSLAAVLMWGCGGTWGAGGVAPPRSTGLSLSDALAMSSSPDSGPDDLVHHAVALLEHGHWARADRLVRRALVRSPRHLSALIVDARIAVARGDLDHAWTRLDDAITLEPAVLRDSNVSSEFVALTIQLSRELRRTRGYGDALALFERLRQPPFVEASSLSAELSRELNAELVPLSQTFIRRGLAHQAKRALRLAADRGASMEEENAAFVSAQIDVSSDETSLSVERWARADPEKRWLRAARFSESIGHDNEALEAYRSAAAAVPTSAAAWRGLARACLKTQDVACAQEAYGRAAACSETIADQSDILLTGARVLRDVHGTEASLPLFQAAVALEPARWAVVSGAASALGVRMRHQALERILVAHVGAAADPDAALSRSMNLLHARGWTASSRRLAELLSATPTPPRSLPLALARNLPIHAVHDVERARLIKEALATTDDELNMQMEVARHWLAIGRGQAAIRHLGRAQVLDPENPHALRMLASGSTGAPSSERRPGRACSPSCARTGSSTWSSRSWSRERASPPPSRSARPWGSSPARCPARSLAA